MDQRHKTKAIVGVILWATAFPLAFLVLAIGSFLIHERWSDFHISPGFYLVAFALVQYIAFFWGVGHLAKAKGYSKDMLLVGIFWPAQIIILALLLFALPDKCQTSGRPKRNPQAHRNESQIDRIVRFRRNAVLANVLGVLGVFFALSLKLMPQGLFASHDNAGVAAILFFVPSYAAIINGCWWWVRAKNWHEAVVFIGLAPLAVLLIPYVRLIYVVVPLLLPATMVLMPIILIGIVAVLPDKSGIPKRKRWSRRD